MIEEVVKKAREQFLNEIKLMKDNIKTLEPSEQKKTQLLVKELMEAFNKNDVNRLKKLIEKCQQIS